MPKKINHPLIPPDPTPEEYYIIMQSVTNIYSKLDDPVDKFLVAFIYELRYTQDMAADILGKSPGWVSQRITKIKKQLSVKYKMRE